MNYAIANLELRQYMHGLGVKQWQVALKMGMSEYQLCRKLRHPLNADGERAVREAIDAIAAQQ